VVVEVVAEELDVGNGGRGNGRIAKVAGEQNEGHIADIISNAQAGDVSDFKRRIPARVKYLGRVLNGGLPPSIHKFLNQI
jgi:hypothetical protein